MFTDVNKLPILSCDDVLLLLLLFFATTSTKAPHTYVPILKKQVEFLSINFPGQQYNTVDSNFVLHTLGLLIYVDT